MTRNVCHLALLLGLLSFAGCKKSAAPEPSASRPAPEPGVVPAAAVPSKPPFEGGRRTSFQEVTAQLDPGGSLFLYLATDQWLARLSSQILEFREVALAIPTPGRS